ncbi:MAG: nucleotidyltransferase family protein [Nanoarchaeota archaeon]
MDKLNTAIVLCGGKGTRLRPLTFDIPKSLIPLQGKTVLEHVIDLFKKFDITNIILCVGHMKEQIKNHMGDGSMFGVNITYVEEDEPLGTAGPLKLMKNQGKLPREPFIYCNGDELKELDLEAMLELHKQNNAMATIALTSVDNPSNYGVANLDGNKILEFLEKPENPPSNKINSGLYILTPEVAELVREGFCMVEKDIFPKIAASGRLFGFPFNGQWFDTGTPERYEKAIKEWKPIIN